MPEDDKNPLPEPGEEIELSEEELDNASGGMGDFQTNKPPSTSVGETKSISVGKTVSRQTYSDSLASKIVQGGGHA